MAAAVAFQDITPLKEIERAKDDFLAILSHELLTPITSIKGWTEFALSLRDAATTERTLVVVERNIARLKCLVDDMLDMSRIIHDKFPIKPQQLDLWQLVEQQVEGALQNITQRRVTLIMAPPGEALPVHADPTRFAQVINNLLNNALKFTPEGGTITLRGRCLHEQVELQIHDTGKGVPREFLPRLFQPFIQQEHEGSSMGLGLGLALVKGIVELHHGRVSADSAGLNQGSTFTVALPLALPCTQMTDDRLRLPVSAGLEPGAHP